MPSNRADEMVLAGAAPTPAPGSDQWPMFTVGPVSSSSLTVPSWCFLLTCSSGRSSPASSLMCCLAVDALKPPHLRWLQKSQTLGVAQRQRLVLACLVFIANALYSIVLLLAGGFVSNLLFVALFAWAALGSGRRALFRCIRATVPATCARSLSDFSLEDGEMLACLPVAVLAIRPTCLVMLIGAALRRCAGRSVPHQQVQRRRGLSQRTASVQRRLLEGSAHAPLEEAPHVIGSRATPATVGRRT